jgi:hypothetical protein
LSNSRCVYKSLGNSSEQYAQSHGGKLNVCFGITTVIFGSLMDIFPHIS